MLEFVLPQVIQLGDSHRSFKDIHIQFDQTNYGAILMAERAGFEPAVAKGHTRFPGVPIKPLSNLSISY